MLEVMIAAVLFTLVMSAMMAVWVTHAKAIDKSQEQQVAGAIAQAIMEQQRNKGYQAVNITSQPFFVDRTMRVVTSSAEFRYTVTVNPQPHIWGPTYKNVVVNVSYQDSVGPHTFTLESNAGW
jgi:type II secretory pathway pseudopilin PulG